MRPQSCKAKGRKHQQLVAAKIGTLLGVKVEKDGDIESRPMGQPGSDIILRGDAKKIFPFGIECKNVENLSIWKALEQAEQYGEPLLFFTRNRTPRYVALREDKFFELCNKVLTSDDIHLSENSRDDLYEAYKIMKEYYNEL